MYEVQGKQAGFKMQQTIDKQQIDFKSKQNRGYFEYLKNLSPKLFVKYSRNHCFLIHSPK